ncbi:MAG: MBL fold metallo-hydrolase, partial [Rhodospirillales bacterium]
MIFRQLFEPQSSTYTYLIGCPKSGRAVLVDPVLETLERDLELIAELGLKLAFTLETHIHADHLTSAFRLSAVTGSQIAVPAICGLECATIGVSEERPLEAGSVAIQPIFTPGHTDHHHCYLIEDKSWSAVLTGDCLLIDGCGRTDFQGGDATAMFGSVRDRLFTLAGGTLVYPGHDYQGRRVSSIAQERARNPRLGEAMSLAGFVECMANLDLPYPRKIDIAV